MSNRWPVLSILVFTFVFIVAHAVVAGAQTSSSACLAPPTATAQAWRDMFPTGASSNEACEAGCDKWQSTCINMARASFRCFQALIQSLAMLDVVDCNNLTGPEKAGCNESAKENQNSSVDSLQSDLLTAVGVCHDSLSDCINDCID